MKAHFSTVVRPFVGLVRLAAPFGLVLGLGLGLSGPAHAVDGCKLLLCMAGNWQNTSCRFPFNLSLLIFQLALLTLSSCHQPLVWLISG